MAPAVHTVVLPGKGAQCSGFLLVAAGSLLSLDVGDEGPLASLCPSMGSFVCFLYSLRGSRAPPLSCGLALSLCLSVA